jgi:hypothetical protein
MQAPLYAILMSCGVSLKDVLRSSLAEPGRTTPGILVAFGGGATGPFHALRGEL